MFQKRKLHPCARMHTRTRVYIDAFNTYLLPYGKRNAIKKKNRIKRRVALALACCYYNNVVGGPRGGA